MSVEYASFFSCLPIGYVLPLSIMPELPEVETIARTLAPQITGRRISGVSVLLSKSMQGAAELFPLIEGSVIDRVYRRAKLLLLSLTPSGPTRA